MAKREFRRYSMTGEPLFWPTEKELERLGQDRQAYLAMLDEVEQLSDGNFYLMGAGECYLYDPETGLADFSKPLPFPDANPVD